MDPDEVERNTELANQEVDCLRRRREFLRGYQPSTFEKAMYLFVGLAMFVGIGLTLFLSPRPGVYPVLIFVVGFVAMESFVTSPLKSYKKLYILSLAADVVLIVGGNLFRRKLGF